MTNVQRFLGAPTTARRSALHSLLAAVAVTLGSTSALLATAVHIDDPNGSLRSGVPGAVSLPPPDQDGGRGGTTGDIKL